MAAAAEAARLVVPAATEGDLRAEQQQQQQQQQEQQQQQQRSLRSYAVDALSLRGESSLGAVARALAELHEAHGVAAGLASCQAAADRGYWEQLAAAHTRRRRARKALAPRGARAG